MLTRKTYELTARILKAAVSGFDSPNAVIVRDRIADDFAAAFAQDNPRFNYARFIAAIEKGM